MFYLEKAMSYLAAYDIYVLAAAFASVWIFGFANWCKNPYRSQNKKFNRCQHNVTLYPSLADCYAEKLPSEYSRQWRAFVNSKAERPSLVFEFVPRKSKTIFVELMVVAALVSAAYLCAAIFVGGHREYYIFQVAFWLAFAVVMLVNKALSLRKEKKARQCFGRLVHRLNLVKSVPQKEPPKTVAKQIKEIKPTQFNSHEAIEKASQLLRQNGLENNRTVAEQRQINKALNSLLQAYARKAATI